MRKSDSKIALLYLLPVICFISAGCIIHVESSHSSFGSQHSRLQLYLKIILDKTDSDALPVNLSRTERQWVSHNNWYPKPPPDYYYIDIMLEKSDSGSIIGTTNVRIDKDKLTLPWPQSNQPGEPVELIYNSDLGRLTFEGRLGRADYDRYVTAYGTVSIEISHDQINRIETAFGQRPSLCAIIPMILKDTPTDRMLKYADCGIQFSIDQAVDLAAYNFDASLIKKLNESGYKYQADDIFTLARSDVSVDSAIQWKKAGYDLPAQTLVYAKQHDISPEFALQWKQAAGILSLEKLNWIKQRNLQPEKYQAWKKAGYELTLEQLYWNQQRDLSPTEAAEWRDIGYDLSPEKLYWVKQRDIKTKDAAEWRNAYPGISLEDVYWAKQRNLQPQHYLAWKKLGYDLSLEKLYWIQQRDLHSIEAAEWKQLGYKFSIEDLYELRRYDIKPSYGAAFSDPGYEQLSARQLIEFKRSNISPETIKRIRKPISNRQ
jgi:hypothetical protein